MDSFDFVQCEEGPDYWQYQQQLELEQFEYDWINAELQILANEEVC